MFDLFGLIPIFKEKKVKLQEPVLKVPPPPKSYFSNVIEVELV